LRNAKDAVDKARQKSGWFKWWRKSKKPAAPAPQLPPVNG
jgi:hypothetical protein